MYDQGLGVSQVYAEAARWFRLAGWVAGSSVVVSRMMADSFKSSLLLVAGDGALSGFEDKDKLFSEALEARFTQSISMVPHPKDTFRCRISR